MLRYKPITSGDVTNIRDKNQTIRVYLVDCSSLLPQKKKMPITVFNAKQSSTNQGRCLSDLPNEVIIVILQNLTIPDILNIARLLNYRLRTLANTILVEKLLNADNCHLRLCFDQENHWRFTTDFKLTKATETRLAFTPVEPTSVPMYTSKLLRRPLLYKACLVGPDFVDLSDSLVHNLIKSPLALNIKEIGLHQQHYALKQRKSSLFFAYRVSKTPENIVKARPGERWIEPLGFECAYDFLGQPKRMIQRVFDSLHSRPTRRQIDGRSYTSSSRLPLQGQRNTVAEIGGLWQQKYQYISPIEKLTRTNMMPIIGGLTASTMDTPTAH
jgi:hypothetical protein